MDIIFNKVSDIITEYINTHNQNNTTRKYIRSSGLTINKNNNEPIKIAQLQPEEKIIADPIVGTYTENELLYESKIDMFLNESMDDGAALVLTPEYSVPYNSIDRLLDDVSKLRIGTLFCLCAQGLSNGDVEDYISKWETKQHCYVYRKALNNMDSKDFLCILFYIFRISFFIDESNRDDMIFIIPQLKMQHMRDDTYEFETGHLSTGYDVFYFDIEPEQSYKEVGNSKNIFLSLMCSDAFEYRQFTDFIRKENYGIFIFHPQLNPKPKHDIFVSFRNELFDTTNKVVLIISTWGKATTVNQKEFNIPNSAIHLPISEKKEYVAQNSELINQNHIKGLTVGITRNRVKWLFPGDEYYILYSIMKPDSYNCSQLTRVRNPYIYGVFSYDKQKRIFYQKAGCLYKPDEVLNIINTSMPIDKVELIENLCSGCDCTQCKISDFLYFIGSFFKQGNTDFIEYILSMDRSELCNQIRPDNKSEETVKKHIVLMRQLMKCIQEKNMPSELLALFKLGPKFYVKNGKRIKEIYNISFSKTRKKVRFLCLGSSNKQEVESLFDKLSREAEDEDETNAIIIMYMNDEECETNFYHKTILEIDNYENLKEFEINKSNFEEV